MMTVLTGYFVLFKYGPTFMTSLKPYKLKSVMTFYNFVQVIANTVFGCWVRLFSEASKNSQLKIKNFRCSTNSSGDLRSIGLANQSTTVMINMELMRWTHATFTSVWNFWILLILWVHWANKNSTKFEFQSDSL